MFFHPGYVSRFLLCSQLSSVMLLWAVNAKDHCPDSFDCGSLGAIRFPFTKAGREGCGALAIHGCDDGKPPFHFINISGKKFQVTKIDVFPWFQTTIHIIDEDLRRLLGSGRRCQVFDRNITLPPLSHHLGYFTIWSNITLFKCKRNLNVRAPEGFLKNTSCAGCDIFFRPTPDSDDVAPHSLAACSAVQLPTHFPISANLFGFLTDEIPLQFNPSAECDQCQGGLDHDGRPRGRCFLDSEGNFHCAKRKDRHQARLLGLILGVGIGPWIILGLILLTLRHRKRKHGRAHVQLQSTIASAVSSSGDHTQTDRIFFGVPIFSYKELQEATNNFDCTRKLGEGGFGRVYYGKLVDGREVAVKHLFYHNYRRVEQFMNEITILTCLRHRNLVSLYGCTSRDSRELLLVYEYIPNGTVASHLRGDLSRAGFLTWPIRMQIAIETATALAYLHASDIIHRDVKTNNILLDINFSVKVADFGLSRLFPSDATHVFTAPQGSPGYLDPEYFQCYQLTAKSDVYSFGVVLIELISSLPAVDTTRDRDEINLASLATKKIQQCALSELLDPSLGFESNQEVRRKLTAVAELAFQCVQVDKELRPSMDEVLNALKKIESGSLESEQLEKGDEKDGAVISQSEELQPPSMASGDRSQVRFLMNKKLPSSPNSLTEKWESASTTPSASASASA